MPLVMREAELVAMASYRQKGPRDDFTKLSRPQPLRPRRGEGVDAVLRRISEALPCETAEGYSDGPGV